MRGNEQRECVEICVQSYLNFILFENVHVATPSNPIRTSLLSGFSSLKDLQRVLTVTPF